MTQRLLYFLSPFTIFILFLLTGSIYKRFTFSGDTTHWSHSAASVFIPCFFIFGALAVFARYLLKEKILWIWIVELAVLTALFIAMEIII